MLDQSACTPCREKHMRSITRDTHKHICYEASAVSIAHDSKAGLGLHRPTVLTEPEAASETCPLVWRAYRNVSQALRRGPSLGTVTLVADGTQRAEPLHSACPSLLYLLLLSRVRSPRPVRLAASQPALQQKLHEAQPGSADGERPALMPGTDPAWCGQV